MNSNPKIKYYVYISPSKIDMLFHQIPKELQSSIQKGLEIDLKLIKMSFSEKQIDETLYSKLSIVIKYLEKNGGIGDVFTPKEYFKGLLFMEWAQIHASVVFWGGKVNDIAIGLGGSMNNVLGHETKDVEKGISHTPWLVSLLSQEVESIIKPSIVQENEFIKDGESEFERRVLASTYSWADDLSIRSYQKCEFVAKKLRFANYQNHRVLLGTPLYVAITER